MLARRRNPSRRACAVALPIPPWQNDPANPPHGVPDDGDRPGREYFLFDPKEDYLDPSLRGYRLSRGKYVPIKQVEGRLPSAVLDLDLYRSGKYLRLYDSRKNRTLPTPAERAEQAETAHL